MATVGSGQYTYELIENWGNLPSGQTFGRIVAMAVDSQDRLYAFQALKNPPNDTPVTVLDRDGNFLSSWGNGFIAEPHSIKIGSDDVLYLTDKEDHVALKYTLDGKLLTILGTRGQPSDTGCTEEAAPVLRPAGPFNTPTDLVRAPSGDLYASDGYCNCRIHRFSSTGGLISSWGNPGKTAPGEFHVPHCLWVDRQGQVYVCDRENSRVQVFTATGDFLAQWTDVDHPTGIFMDANETVYVSEGSSIIPSSPTLAPRISVRDKQGNILASLDAPSPPHWLSGDSRGDLYLALPFARQGMAKYVKRR